MAWYFFVWMEESAAVKATTVTPSSNLQDKTEDHQIDSLIQENHENLQENSLPKPSKGNEEDLYDEPEDLNTQTVIQNRYCFWCHRRGGKQSVSFILLCYYSLPYLLLPPPSCRIIMRIA